MPLFYDIAAGKVFPQNQNWIFAGGLKFDGLNDEVYAGNTTTFNAVHQTNNFAITFFVKPNTIANNGVRMVCATTNNGGNRGFTISRRVGTQLVMGINYDTTATNIYAVTVNNFFTTTNVVHIAWVGNGTNSLLYKDGVLFATLPNFTFTGIGNAGFPISLGSRQAVFFWDGQMYGFNFFNSSITAAGVKYLYDTKGQSLPSPPNSSGATVVNFPFRNGQGTTLTDVSGNATNGTLIGYLAGDVAFGITNSWLDQYGNPILTA